MKSKSLIKILCVVVLAFWPIVVDQVLITRYNYYETLRRFYGCSPVDDSYYHLNQCTGDFDGDGKPGKVDLLLNPKDYLVGKIVVVDSDRTLFSLKYVYHDEPNKRALFAIRHYPNEAHLIVLDGISRTDPLTGIYAWDGKQMSQTQPSKIENDILDALGAEGAGNWDTYVLFRKGALFIYYAFFFAAAFWLQLRLRRAMLARLRPSLP